MSTATDRAIPTWGEVKSLLKTHTLTKSFNITVGGNALSVPHYESGSYNGSVFNATDPMFNDLDKVEFQFFNGYNYLGVFSLIALPGSNVFDTLVELNSNTTTIRYNFIPYNANYLATMYSNIETPSLVSAEFTIMGDDEFGISLQMVLGAYVTELLVKCIMMGNVI